MNETKEHILRTSLSLFLQKSYRDVTMKEIVEKSGLSKGAFYHYFESKDALFKEIVDHFLSYGKIDYSQFNSESFLTFYRDYAKYNSSSMMEIAKFVGNGDTEENPVNFFFIMFEAIRKYPEFLKTELEMHKYDVAEWAKIIKNARAKGEIISSSSNEEIAEIFLYCTDGIAIRGISMSDLNFITAEILKVFDSLYEGIKS